MNIFVISADPYEAARMHCDKHVNKMLSESAQMLSTVLWPSLVTESERGAWKSKDKEARVRAKQEYKARTGLFLPSHSGHPCTKWCGNTRANFEWLCKLGDGLSQEFEYRRYKKHGSSPVVYRAWNYIDLIPEGKLEPFVQAFKTNYAHLIDPSDPVGAYRKFYIADKSAFASWSWRRPPPDWWPKDNQK